MSRTTRIQLSNKIIDAWNNGVTFIGTKREIKWLCSFSWKRLTIMDMHSWIEDLEQEILYLVEENFTGTKHISELECDCSDLYRFLNGS